MNRLVLFSILSVCIVTGCVTRRLEPSGPPRPERFVGTWRLVSWTSTADGQTNHPFGADASGLLTYTAAGRMSVFLSRTNRPVFARTAADAGTAGEKVAAFDSCFAYAGTFEVAEGRVTHRLEHCTFPNWVGTEQVRYVRFDCDRLILETTLLPSDRGVAVSRLTWERIRPCTNPNQDLGHASSRLVTRRPGK